MNILKWLTNTSGKLPVTLAQAAGITAVVGAAGFGAISFLGSSSDNNSFLPPTATSEQVVYISQNGGGGQYESNGEVGSSFKAAPSRAIQLANQQAQREAQARALQEASQQMPSVGGGDAPQMPQAYQLTGADLGQGLGGGQNKDASGTLDAFSAIQNQLSGVSQLINNAQAGAAQAPAAGAPAGTTPEGQNAAQLASAPRNWGNNGLTHAGGGGSGSSNSYAIQDSGKNKRNGAPSAGTVAEAGDAIAQAQAAMAQLKEGSRIQAPARFGSSEGLKGDKDARMAAMRRFANSKAELEFIRKQSALIATNKTNSGNEAGRPFLASAVISGGVIVDGEQVTTGETSTSGDLKGANYDKALQGLNNRMNQLQDDMDKRDASRSKLKLKIFTIFAAILAASVAIAILVNIAKSAVIGLWWWVAAAVLTAASLGLIFGGLIPTIKDYISACGGETDGWAKFGKWMTYGVLPTIVGLGWLSGLVGKTWFPEQYGMKVLGTLPKMAIYLGFGGIGGMGMSEMFGKKGK